MTTGWIADVSEVILGAGNGLEELDAAREVCEEGAEAFCTLPLPGPSPFEPLLAPELRPGCECKEGAGLPTGSADCHT